MIDDYLRFGFNGKEKDENQEWGDLTHYDYGFRIYNPGIGRFLSVDPLTKSYPWYTPYQFAGNNPIKFIDLDGLEEALPEEEYNRRFTSVRNNLLRSANSVEDTDRQGFLIESVNEALDDLNRFRNANQRPISTYSLLRYLEGEGGYDIFDIERLGDFRMFNLLYDRAITKIETKSKKLFDSDKNSMSFIEYSSRGQDGTTLFNDYGTAIGSAGMRYRVVLEKISDDEIKGTAYFTFADTYRWEADRGTFFSAFGIGDHEQMAALTEIGAAPYSIRGFFTIDFTATTSTWGTKLNYPPASELTNSGKTGNHLELSPTAGYRLLSPNLIFDHSRRTRHRP